MSFDVARVRGLYVTLSDGWTYLNAHDCPQIPEKVSAGVATAFRLSPKMEAREPTGGTHSRIAASGTLVGEGYVEAARRALADLAGVQPRQVILGPDRHALMRTLVQAMSGRLKASSTIIASRGEDPTLLRPLRTTEAQFLFAEPDLGTGQLPAEQFTRLITGATRLVFIPAAHAYVGAVTDVKAIAATVHERSRAWVVVDASAYAPYRPIDIENWGADMVLVDCAALGGPDIAALILRDESMFLRLTQLNQEAQPRTPQALEPNRLSTGLLGGVAPAIDHLAGLGGLSRGTRRTRLRASMKELEGYMDDLTHQLVEHLMALPGVHVVGASGETGQKNLDRVPRVTFALPGVPAPTIHQRMIDNGIVATVSPRCPLLDSMGVEEAGGSVTVGLGPFNTPFDIWQLTRAVASLA